MLGVIFLIFLHCEAGISLAGQNGFPPEFAKDVWRDLDSLEASVSVEGYVSPISISENKPDGRSSLQMLLADQRWRFLLTMPSGNVGPVSWDGTNQFISNSDTLGRKLLSISKRENQDPFSQSCLVLLILFKGVLVDDQDGKLSIGSVQNLLFKKGGVPGTTILDASSHSWIHEIEVDFENPYLSKNKIKKITTRWPNNSWIPSQMECFSMNGKLAYSYKVTESKPLRIDSRKEPLISPTRIQLDIFDPTDQSDGLSQVRNIFVIDQLRFNRRVDFDEFASDPADFDVIYDEDEKTAITVPR
jgi:hypothetical protein